LTTQADAEAIANRLYASAVANTRTYLAAVTEGHWGDPSPCTDWDILKLVTHIVTNSMNAKRTMEGNERVPAGTDVLGSDALAAFDSATTATIAAFNEPGAMQRTVVTRRGDETGGAFALVPVQEMLVHGWDLGKAVGGDTALPADVVEVQYARALRMRENLRPSGAWGEAEAAVADDADTQTKYLAILGRAS
jgi:uncharacterized protein (TIGR03086 family)